MAKIEKGEKNSLELRVVLGKAMVLARFPDSYPSPGGKPHLKDGTYYVRIGVHADNASAAPMRFRISNRFVEATDPDYGFDKAPCRIELVS